MFKRFVLFTFAMLLYSCSLVAQNHIAIHRNPNFDRHFAYIIHADSVSKDSIKSTNTLYKSINSFYFSISDTLYSVVTSFFESNNTHFYLGSDDVIEKMAISYTIMLYKNGNCIKYDIKIEDNFMFFSNLIDTVYQSNLFFDDRFIERLESFKNSKFKTPTNNPLFNEVVR